MNNDDITELPINHNHSNLSLNVINLSIVEFLVVLYRKMLK